MSKTMFSNLKELIAICESTKSSGRKVFDMVELWKPCVFEGERPRESHIEIVTSTGASKSIYFEIGADELASKIYNKLRHYNKMPTALEKFHASF